MNERRGHHQVFPRPRQVGVLRCHWSSSWLGPHCWRSSPASRRQIPAVWKWWWEWMTSSRSWRTSLGFTRQDTFPQDGHEACGTFSPLHLMSGWLWVTPVKCCGMTIVVAWPLHSGQFARYFKGFPLNKVFLTRLPLRGAIKKNRKKWDFVPLSVTPPPPPSTGHP